MYQSASRQYLHRYLWKWDFCWNPRESNDRERSVAAIKPADGKRFIYRGPKKGARINSKNIRARACISCTGTYSAIIMDDENTSIERSEIARQLSLFGASKGGKARAKSMSSEQRREAARKAVEARWAKQGKAIPPRATHSGFLHIGDLEIECAVLETGQRVLSQSGFQTALGLSIGGTMRKTESGYNLPLFLSFASLKPFITHQLECLLQQDTIRYMGSRGGAAMGFKAELIPKVCDVWLQARQAGALKRSQLRIATKAEIIMRGLAQVGIIALVDEATGYQADRTRDALAKILEAFIAKELRPWARTFQPEFYQELFRLKGLEFTGKVRGPRHIAQATNDLVYRRLAPGVMEELNRINPTNDKGQRKHKQFQWLTQQIGYQKLLQHLSAVTALMKAFDDWDTFKIRLDRALPLQAAAPLFDPPKDIAAKNPSPSESEPNTASRD